MSVQFASLGDVKPVVVAGGKDTSKFAPNLNISFFDDEFYININRKDKIVTTQTAVTANGKTELGGDDKDIWHIDKDGRLKWDIEFASRPAADSWTWKLKHSAGLEFYHQPELTAEEVKRGCSRPEDVIGSYAVYCNKRNRKYKNSKLCHIYRPIFIDANGNIHIGVLLIESGKSLTISADKTWLDKAVYPAKLDPYISYTTAPASWDGATTNALVCNMYNNTAAESGTAQKVHWYVRRTTSAQETSIGYYDANGDGSPNVIQDSGTVNVTSATGEWVSIDVSGTITEGEDYIPAFLANSRIEPAYDSIGSQSWGYAAASTFIDDPSITRYYSTAGFYIEYGEASSQSPVPTIMNAMNQFNGGL